MIGIFDSNFSENSRPRVGGPVVPPAGHTGTRFADILRVLKRQDHDNHSAEFTGNPGTDISRAESFNEHGFFAPTAIEGESAGKSGAPVEVGAGASPNGEAGSPSPDSDAPASARQMDQPNNTVAMLAGGLAAESGALSDPVSPAPSESAIASSAGSTAGNVSPASPSARPEVGEREGIRPGQSRGGAIHGFEPGGGGNTSASVSVAVVVEQLTVAVRLDPALRTGLRDRIMAMLSRRGISRAFVSVNGETQNTARSEESQSWR